MRSRYRILERDFSHFITGTTVDWLPIFTTAARCDILVQAFEYCRQHKALKLRAWVILDTHFHAIVAAPNLARVLADLKRHTARRIIELLEEERCTRLLRELRHGRAPYKTESQYQVWQEGSHPQAIMSDEMMLQKLEYVHNNPVKRGLVAAPEHGRYSSAHEWLPGAAVALRCDPWRGEEAVQLPQSAFVPFPSATWERGTKGERESTADYSDDTDGIGIVGRLIRVPPERSPSRACPSMSLASLRLH